MDEPLLGIDLNQLPIDEEWVIELDEYPKEIGGQVHFHEYIELTESGKKKNDVRANNFHPFIGQCFLSEEEAFIFYKKYACAKGFSIRKDRTEKKNGEIQRRDFCCQCEGKAPLKLCDPSKEQRNRKSVRCGCKARMRITLRKSFDIFPQEWQVTEFVKEHNHELLTPLEVRFLPANRKIVKKDEDRILLLKEDTPEEFEHQWPHVVAKYDLQNNKHIVGLYEIKHYWVPAYLRNYFFGGMTTTGRSESINAYVKRFISSHTNLDQFVRQVDLAIENIQQRQLHNTMLQKYRGSTLRTMSPLEEQACGVLTPFCFEKFQEQFGRAALYSLVHNHGCEFVIKHHEDTKGKIRIVFWDGEMSTCSCKHFEFWGILCRHILSVFLHKDCYRIPSLYLPSRWCREVSQSDEVTQSGEGSQRLDEEILVDKPIGDVHCPPISITKGCPKTKRLQTGRETKKVARSCGWCKKVGHNITTCPEKENIEHATDSQRKKKKITSSDVGLNPVFSLKY
ncbi:hypothetical protein RHGRI_008276 [Rhododendron griersonianum]|uniref:Protein FAR1-RELATED SEQUENCE n=1 Tax=Rhododendron griersonianum TaxID=479676 RepID=A0AAV6KZS7_9ERIC|nr:hypothetical protein RHGRI_008276 [Rhododendron griersonianum]